MQLISGKAVSADIRQDLAAQTIEFEKKFGRVPALAVIIVGDDPASHTYVNNKIKGCAQVGFRSICQKYENGTPQEEIAAYIRSLAEDDGVDGSALSHTGQQGCGRIQSHKYGTFVHEQT